jgi:hypothetical protein
MERMRQRIDARRNRDSTGGNWFRVGVLSATVLAPLIARWTDLRASNRAQAWRDLAAARLSEARDARDRAVVRLAPARAAANARLSDARDLASARLSDARELASARFDDAVERLSQASLPDALRNVPPFSIATRRAEELQRQRQRRRRQTTMLWLAGVGVGLVAAGVTAYFVARKRMASAIEDEEPMVELPAERNLAEAVVGRNSGVSGMSNSYSATDGQPVGAFSDATGAVGMMGTAAPGQARYIGNIHTMVFHDVDDKGHLPAEENRIYFASEDEARQAGYRYSRESADAPKPENPA